MTTFNADSLDFVDDETVRHGEAPDFEWGFDSANTRLEVDDLVNGVTAYVQQNRAGDLVDGRFAQAVAEGKALADDGNVYDTINGATSSASSWVKVGPGYFNEEVAITDPGMTVVGSGEQTIVEADTSQVLNPASSDITIADMRVRAPTDESGIGVFLQGNGCIASNITVEEAGGDSLSIGGDDCLVQNCTVESSGRYGVTANGDRDIVVGTKISNCASNGIILQSGDDSIIANNTISKCENGILVAQDDSITLANRILNCRTDGIRVGSVDVIVANNRVSDSGNSDIQNNGTGTVLDANLTGPSN